MLPRTLLARMRSRSIITINSSLNMGEHERYANACSTSNWAGHRARAVPRARHDYLCAYHNVFACVFCWFSCAPSSHSPLKCEVHAPCPWLIAESRLFVCYTPSAKRARVLLHLFFLRVSPPRFPACSRGNELRKMYCSLSVMILGRFEYNIHILHIYFIWYIVIKKGC